MTGRIHSAPRFNEGWIPAPNRVRGRLFAGMTKGDLRVPNGETPAKNHGLNRSCPAGAAKWTFDGGVGANWRSSKSPGVGGVHFPFDEVRDPDGPVFGEELDLLAVVPGGVDPLDDANS